MEIREMTIDQLEERKQTIVSADMLVEGADLDALEAEMRSINAELEQRKADEAAREEQRKAIAQGAGEVIAEVETEIETEERQMFTVETAEYRKAFYDYLVTGDREARTTLINVDGNTAGTVTADAIAIPKTLDEKIWDNIHTAHPILADITTIASGIVMEVTKHTAIATRVTGKKDADTTASAEDNTFVKVTLAGVDYEKYVELTYAEARMSVDALETYLASEISAELGEALAKDVFARILSDATSSQSVTGTTDMFADVKGALAKATMGGRKVVYAPSNKYYDIVGAINSAGGNPYNIGTTLGVEVKMDDAATKVTIVDPKAFVLNEISGVMVETDKDIKSHKVVISGYLRAEGCLRINKAAAYIA